MGSYIRLLDWLNLVKVDVARLIKLVFLAVMIGRA